VPNGDWSVRPYSTKQLKTMFKRPLTTKELREHHLGNSENVLRFRTKNDEVQVLDGGPQLNYVKGWFETLDIEERTPYDYILHRRIQLQEYEGRAKRFSRTPKNMRAIAGALRSLASYYVAAADQLEEAYAETDEESDTD
jgi:hypothetical protein